MRKALAIAPMGSLALGLLSSPALPGDPHAVRNRWAGVAIGAGAATLGGLLLASLWSPLQPWRCPLSRIRLLPLCMPHRPS
jgi:hypothetical protein